MPATGRLPPDRLAAGHRSLPLAPLEARRDRRTHPLAARPPAPPRRLALAPRRGLAPPRCHLFWKLLGLAHGPVVLDAVIDLYQSLPVSSLNQVEAALSAQQRRLLRRQALKAVSSLRLRDPFAALQLLDTEVRC